MFTIVLVGEAVLIDSICLQPVPRDATALFPMRLLLGTGGVGNENRDAQFACWENREESHKMSFGCGPVWIF